MVKVGQKRRFQGFNKLGRHVVAMFLIDCPYCVLIDCVSVAF